MSKLVEVVLFSAVIVLAATLNQTFAINLLVGFHIWIHKFGHATVTWLSGYRALPLPIGWAKIEETKSNFVYFGILFLPSVFSRTSWKERKKWPLIIVIIIVPIEAYMTSFWPNDQHELRTYWAGIGAANWALSFGD